MGRPEEGQDGRNGNPRLNKKHEIFNNYLGQFCNHESTKLVRDQFDQQLLSDLHPEQLPMLDGRQLGVPNKKQGGETSQGDEDCEDQDNEHVPQSTNNEKQRIQQLVVNGNNSG